MAAVNKLVFEDKSVSKEALLDALESNFENAPELHFNLRRNAPKLGRDPESKVLAEELVQMYTDSLKGLVNERGGTGSACTICGIPKTSVQPPTAAASANRSPGADVKTIQGILGQKDYKTTMDRYVHPIEKRKHEAVSKIGAMLSVSV